MNKELDGNQALRKDMLELASDLTDTHDTDLIIDAATKFTNFVLTGARTIQKQSMLSEAITPKVKRKYTKKK